MGDREHWLTSTPKQQYPEINPAIRPYIGPNGDSSLLVHVHLKKDAL